jgi:hypothetical protein
LEALLLLVLLAGADPSAVPSLERLLAWGLGALAPAIVFWKRPADPFSLLLLQAPLRGRSVEQRSLSNRQSSWATRLILVVGCALLLPGFWWLDSHAALAGPMALLPDANRLVDLLLAIPVLALMLWQWHQLTQALWLLSRSPASLASSSPMGQSQLEEQRLCLGLPLLLLAPFPAPETAPERAPEDVTALAEPEQPEEEPVAAAAQQEPAEAEAPVPTETEVAPESDTPEPDTSVAATAVDTAVVDTAVTVEPEQATEQPHSSELDEQVG